MRLCSCVLSQFSTKSTKTRVTIDKCGFCSRLGPETVFGCSTAGSVEKEISRASGTMENRRVRDRSISTPNILFTTAQSRNSVVQTLLRPAFHRLSAISRLWKFPFLQSQPIIYAQIYLCFPFLLTFHGEPVKIAPKNREKVLQLHSALKFGRIRPHLFTFE